VVTILACQSKKRLRLFEQIPELLYENDPYFVPPFPGSVLKLIGSKSPLIRAGGELHPFIAYKNGKPVGRIAAIINPAHNKYYGDSVGFFGFFEFTNDIEVARALLEKAREVLREKGMSVVRGPYSPTVNDECGLLIDGFEAIPSVMMAYNPAYYSAVYEQLGLKKVRDLYAYYLPTSCMPPEKVGRVAKRVKRNTGIQFRNISMANLNEELKIIKELYNETLCRNWGFVPVTYDELLHAADDLKAIIDPEMVIIAEKDGKAVGFSMVIPNINEFMFQARKFKRTWLRVLKFVWLLKTRRPREVRLALLGVKPEYRASGISAVFYYEAIMRSKSKYLGGELSWIEETNKEMISGLELLGGKRYRTYGIYEKLMGATA
jgi:hypothetical protein